MRKTKATVPVFYAPSLREERTSGGDPLIRLRQLKGGTARDIPMVRERDNGSPRGDLRRPTKSNALRLQMQQHWPPNV